MTLEDSWGGDIVTAAIAHLAHSTPAEFQFTATDFNSYVTVSIAEGAPQRVNDEWQRGTRPGLGITRAWMFWGSPYCSILKEIPYGFSYGSVAVGLQSCRRATAGQCFVLFHFSHACTEVRDDLRLRFREIVFLANVLGDVVKLPAAI